MEFATDDEGNTEEVSYSEGNRARDYIKQYGRPLSLYSDRGSTYKVNTAKDVTRHDITHTTRQ